MVVLNLGHLFITFLEEFVVVQVARVAGNAVVVAHVDGSRHFLARHQSLVEFFAMARADDLYLCLTIFGFYLGVSLLQRFGQYGERGSRSFLDKEISVVTVGESIDDQVYSVVERRRASS